MFPFQSWGLAGMQGKEKACKLCYLLVLTGGAKWQALGGSTSGALGWAWEFHSEDSEIRKCQGAGAAEWLVPLLTRATFLWEER